MHSAKHYSVNTCGIHYPKPMTMSLKQRKYCGLLTSRFFFQIIVLESIMLLEFLAHLRIEQKLLHTFMKHKI